VLCLLASYVLPFIQSLYRLGALLGSSANQPTNQPINNFFSCFVLYLRQSRSLLPTFVFGPFPSHSVMVKSKIYENVTDTATNETVVQEDVVWTKEHRSLTLSGGWLKLQLLLRALVVLRLLSVGRGTRDVIDTICRIRDVLALFVAVFFLIIYVRR
jgi:hypothetical protein